MIKTIFKKKKLLIPFLIFILILTGCTGYLIYMLSLFGGIEDTIRYIVMGVLGLVWLLLSIFLGKSLVKKKKRILIIFLLLIFSFLCGFIAFNINKASSALDIVTSDNYIVYSTSIVTTKDNSADKISDIGKKTLGIINDTESIDGYQIAQTIIEENDLNNKTKEYSGYIDIINDLLNGKIEFAFLPTNYSTMFSSVDGYENLSDQTKTIYTKTKKIKKAKEKKVDETSKITKPFTILLMGVDSEKEGIENGSLNGDSLMVISFNPETLNATVLSIPRDSYVPISCFPGQRKNKITHAAWQGETCMEKTIENFLDIDIDYYVKINFTGVVKLVDNLGGVEIDVPYNLCEQNSKRQWGSNTVYIEQGIKTLNGEQALAYARNRHPNPSYCSNKWTNYNSNDFIRGQHQQEVVTSLLNKLKGIDSLNTVYDLLDTISSNMATNMSREQILSLYNVGKKLISTMDNEDSFKMQRLYINGYDQRIYDYGGTNLSLYNYVPYKNSVKEVSNAIKTNLGQKDAKVIKSMSFDVNEPFVEEVIGKTITGGTTLTLLPSFIGQASSYAVSYGNSHGFKVTVNGNAGTITAQNIPSGANVEDVKNLTVTTSTVKEQNKEETETKKEKTDDEETNNDTENSSEETATCKGKETEEADCKLIQGTWDTTTCTCKTN